MPSISMQMVTIFFALVLLVWLIYWQIFIAEGVFLGQKVVTLLYDIYAERYDSIKEYNLNMEAQILGKPLAEALIDIPSPLVLDIGTGTARLPLSLLEQPVFSGHVVGVDDSKKMLQVAERKLLPHSGRYSLLWRDATTVPFPENCFDMVSLLEMLEFTPSPKDQLGEAVRVLRPGGLLVTSRRRGVDALLMPGKTHSSDEFQELLLDLGLRAVTIMPWQMDYDLVTAMKRGSSPIGPRNILETMLCSRCGFSPLVPVANALLCDTCGHRHAQSGAIIHMK